ncbi:MAG: lytic transglycosylase domain-containing protein [Bdellovibrionales bacterium]|jgi:soluble lytic murein transglycosylase|nr:lytic transglycosylase domain-containing protein [Bdellovibrionales bacterium]
MSKTAVCGQSNANTFNAVFLGAISIAVSSLISQISLAATLVSMSLDESFNLKNSTVTHLRTMRSAYDSARWEQCLSEAAKAKRVAKSLQPWILSLELECASKLSATKANANRLSRILAQVDGQKEAMAYGPWASRLRKAWAKTSLVAIDMDQKTNRVRALAQIEKLAATLAAHSAAFGDSAMRDAFLDASERAKFWKIGGELHFLAQKNGAAREFYRRSVAEQEQSDVRERLRLLDAQLSTAKVETAPFAPTAKQPDGDAEEIELADRIAGLLKAGDLVAAGADSMKLMREFPGSPRAKWAADRVLENMISVSEKNADRFLPLRDALLKQMTKGEPERVAEWARVLFNRGLWAESAALGKEAVEKLEPSRATRALELAMDAAYAIDDFKMVRRYAEELISKHAGTAASRTAALRLGLEAYRRGDYARSIAVFERLVATQSSETLELQARYWLWRSLEKIKSERAKIEGEELARRFPFSYYGLRARLEGGDGRIDWSKENTVKGKVVVAQWLTQEEKLGWERAGFLISSGWFDEAQAELRLLPVPVTPEEKAVRAHIWSLAKNFLLASRLANEAWDAKFELRRPELMQAAWPAEFKSLFETSAKAKGLSPLLTRSLTKQESGYNTRAVSTSNALGLMQMIPPTAREIAVDLKLGTLNLPDDMFEPKRNIEMGTHYIAKMLNQFKGHVPLALAAYNAGPTRLNRWLGSRPTLAGLADSRSSASEFEIWIDEFPFSETSFYVKAILRNVLLYQIVETGAVAQEEPLWKATGASQVASGK